jgi:DNA-binding ferritin-like protein
MPAILHTPSSTHLVDANKTAQSQTEFARVADHLHSIAEQMRSLSVQPQAQPTQVQSLGKFHNEIRDVKNRPRTLENQA